MYNLGLFNITHQPKRIKILSHMKPPIQHPFLLNPCRFKNLQHISLSDDSILKTSPHLLPPTVSTLTKPHLTTPSSTPPTPLQAAAPPSHNSTSPTSPPSPSTPPRLPFPPPPPPPLSHQPTPSTSPSSSYSPATQPTTYTARCQASKSPRAAV